MTYSLFFAKTLCGVIGNKVRIPLWVDNDCYFHDEVSKKATHPNSGMYGSGTTTTFKLGEFGLLLFFLVVELFFHFYFTI